MQESSPNGKNCRIHPRSVTASLPGPTASARPEGQRPPVVLSRPKPGLDNRDVCAYNALN